MPTFVCCVPVRPSKIHKRESDTPWLRRQVMATTYRVLPSTYPNSAMARRKAAVRGSTSGTSAIMPITGIGDCCAHCKWPGDRRAASKDEIAASHSITPSAVASSMGGTERPNASAVLRLITRSNFSGRGTGKSLGFAPCRSYQRIPRTFETSRLRSRPVPLSHWPQIALHYGRVCQRSLSERVEE